MFPIKPTKLNNSSSAEVLEEEGISSPLTSLLVGVGAMTSFILTLMAPLTHKPLLRIIMVDLVNSHSSSNSKVVDGQVVV